MTLVRSQNFIGGRWVDPVDGARAPITNPATGKAIAEAAVSSRSDVDHAVDAAESGWRTWRDTTPRERSEFLFGLAEAMAAHKNELADLESANVGKPILLARGEVDEAIDGLRFFAGAVRSGEGLASNGFRRGTTSVVRREPIGVVGLITAWNFPLMGAIWKAGAALAAGNVCVLKPAEQTPLTTLALADVAAPILPPGVLNVITGQGDPVGSALAQHPRVRMVSVTGAVTTGKAVAAAAAHTLKRVHLELGGNCPAIVFADADLDAVTAGIRHAATVNSGQVCLAATRLLVEKSCYDDLLDRLVPAFESVRVGAPEEGEHIEMGPLAYRGHRDRVAGYIRNAENAKILTGHLGPDADGNFVAPTLITGVEQGDAIVQEEIFGPVVTVQPFDNDAQAVEWANGTPFGLAASMWTGDLSRAMSSAPRLEFGTVWLNDHLSMLPEMPHGGVKDSGYGSEGSSYGIDEFTQVKHLWINHG
ncbi:aldehyde dehydrogenase family protein [Rhodococcus sp. NPDC127530]|uniref:aldehyde dehydrogenase family protein n=1 Tax=unclassified Rhodococcus (in: high G+C Gram-positive bacteria) TaxID=192944 RepID=UPI00363EE139